MRKKNDLLFHNFLKGPWYLVLTVNMPTGCYLKPSLVLERDETLV